MTLLNALWRALDGNQFASDLRQAFHIVSFGVCRFLYGLRLQLACSAMLLLCKTCLLSFQ